MAVAELMKLHNTLSRATDSPAAQLQRYFGFRTLSLLLAPFAPHLGAHWRRAATAARAG